MLQTVHCMLLTWRSSDRSLQATDCVVSTRVCPRTPTPLQTLIRTFPTTWSTRWRSNHCLRSGCTVRLGVVRRRRPVPRQLIWWVLSLCCSITVCTDHCNHRKIQQRNGHPISMFTTLYSLYSLTWCVIWYISQRMLITSKLYLSFFLDVV